MCEIKYSPLAFSKQNSVIKKVFQRPSNTSKAHTAWRKGTFTVFHRDEQKYVFEWTHHTARVSQILQGVGCERNILPIAGIIRLWGLHFWCTCWSPKLHGVVKVRSLPTKKACALKVNGRNLQWALTRSMRTCSLRGTFSVFLHIFCPLNFSLPSSARQYSTNILSWTITNCTKLLYGSLINFNRGHTAAIKYMVSKNRRQWKWRSTKIHKNFSRGYSSGSRLNRNLRTGKYLWHFHEEFSFSMDISLCDVDGNFGRNLMKGMSRI